jgi:hypothetical protein
MREPICQERYGKGQHLAEDGRDRHAHSIIRHAAEVGRIPALRSDYQFAFPKRNRRTLPARTALPRVPLRLCHPLNVPNGERIARFIEPMLLLRTDKLPEGDGWRYEVKFDGYRALAIKSGGSVRLRSRNDKDFTKRYPGVVAALCGLPDETVIDGEVVALDAAGKPAFQLLQNGGTNVHFYAFDVLILSGKDVTDEPLVKRRELLENHVLPGIPAPGAMFPGAGGEPIGPHSVHPSAGPRRAGGQACQQPIRIGTAFGRLDEDARELVPGIHHRWILHRRQHLRRCDSRARGGRQAGVRRADTERVHAGITGRITAQNEATGGQRMPVLQFAGIKAGQVGRRADGGQDEGLPMAAPGIDRAIRVPGMDRGSAFEA